jgi:DDE superfamily endonuclease
MLALPGAAARQRHTAGPTNRPQRLSGARNALTGQVDYLDTSVVGREQVSAFSRRRDQVDPAARRIYVVQDNGSIHPHDDVRATLGQLPRSQPVWLPTYAPWLTPIEQRWHWLRRDLLTGHRLADAWPQLRQQVNRFLAQFTPGSSASAALVHSGGLVGDGHLAYVLQSA